jgi:hypothetical protein
MQPCAFRTYLTRCREGRRPASRTRIPAIFSATSRSDEKEEALTGGGLCKWKVSEPKWLVKLKRITG